MFSSLEGLDQQLFLLLNKALGLKALDPFYEGLSSLGEWTICLVAFSLLAESGRRKLVRHILVLSVVGLLLLGVNTVIKESTSRQRPPLAFQKEIKEGTVQIRIVGKPLSINSMPSGHAMVAFYMMTYVGFCNRSYRFWALLLATLIAVSRICMGAHFPSDCAVGALLGAVGGYVAWQVFKRNEERGWVRFLAERP